MKGYICYHNGKFKKESEVSINFRDLGFQRAYGVFDYLRTYNQKPFQLKWHAKKLISSIEYMNIDIDFGESDFLSIINELFQRNIENIKNNKEYGIKTIITGGTNGKATVVVYLEEFDDSIYDELRINGVSLLSCRVPRHSPESKNIDYKTLFKAHKQLKEKNCLEILHRGDSYVYESGTSNVFMVKNNIVITPVDRIYQGSTREFVLNLALENNYSIEERFIEWKEFINADEVFITASKKEILPVIKIYDGDNTLNFPVGNVTRKLISLFEIKKQDL
ncbi:MAG: aminotransferase class IV [Candidatus Pacebacteria bacterium]|nr:aminotransferase class IV [Candidatus Paceibacterota bacterium]